jgi:hypothetical protein
MSVLSLLWKILVFDEGTESADIATNENILLLDEYSKVKSSGEEMWRVDAYQIPYYSRGIEEAKRTHPRFADWLQIIYNTDFRAKRLNNYTLRVRYITCLSFILDFHLFGDVVPVTIYDK